MIDVERLRRRWRELWLALRATSVPERVFDELVEAYGQPHRAYHGLDHVIDCLRIFDTASSAADRPSEVEAAIWFHDAIYDPARGDNERRSADWAAQVLRDGTVDPGAVRRTEGLILATRHDTPADSRDARLLLDIDLSILGRPRPEFRIYDERIRREYAWVPEAAYCARRAEILESFLRRQPLYLTPALRARFESQARLNLAAAVQHHRARARSLASPPARERTAPRR